MKVVKKKKQIKKLSEVLKEVSSFKPALIQRGFAKVRKD